MPYAPDTFETQLRTAVAPPPLPPEWKDTGAVPPVINKLSELDQKVLDGGRYLAFQYCFSILVMSFKRSRIVFVPPGADGSGDAMCTSLISLVAGWWGIPWGPIWTLSTIIKNAGGGTDVTQAVLAERLGPMRAVQVMAQRRAVPPTGSGMKSFRLALAGLGILLLLLLATPFLLAGLGTFASSRASSSQHSYFSPEEEQFKNANKQISINRGAVAFGNTPKAIAIASAVSVNMRRLRESLFEGGKKDGYSASGHEFLVYCELHDSECAMIMHVPELRRFEGDAKVALGEMAWTTAQTALKKANAAKPGMKLAVGLRGIALYDRVLTGVVVTDTNSPETGLVETVTRSLPEKQLYPFFQKTVSSHSNGTATSSQSGEKAQF